MAEKGKDKDSLERIRSLVKTAVSKGFSLEDIQRKLEGTSADKEMISQVISEFRGESKNEEDFDAEKKLKGIIKAALAKGLMTSDIKKKLYETKIDRSMIDKVLDEYMKPEKKELKAESSMKEKDKDEEPDEKSSNEKKEEKESKDEKEDDENTEKKKDSGKSDDEGEKEEESFSPEEFEKLENKEGNSIIGKIFKKKKDDNQDEKKDDDNDKLEIMNQKEISKELKHLKKTAEQNSIDITKVSGKIDVFKEKNEEVDEQLQNTVEKIGELRSTVLGRERMFNKLEDDFSSVKYTVNNFKPENLDKRFNEVNSQLLKFDSTLDKINARMDKQEDKINHYLKIMESIDSFDNVIKQLKKLQKAEDHISKLERDVEKAASKIEIMLQNTSESVSKINKTHTKSTNNEEAIKDIMNSIAKIEQKTEFFVKKEDFDNVKDDMKVIKKALFKKDYSN